MLQKSLESYDWYTNQDEMKVSRTVVDPNGKFYCIGFKNGLLVQLLATDLSTIKTFWGKSEILDI